MFILSDANVLACVYVWKFMEMCLLLWLFEDDTGVLAAVMKINEYALVMCCLVT